MLVRSHISKLDKLKVRPVYNAPFLFIRLEVMLVWPLLAQLRQEQCQILYGYETIRGGMIELNRIATNFQSYLCIDWSRFDHNAPFNIVDVLFDYYLPSKICTDFGYAKTYNYQQHAFHQAKHTTVDPNYNSSNSSKFVDVFPAKVKNLLTFLKKWYKEMIYITPDGFGYQRTTQGVPSGILCTQFFDSMINYIVVIDSMLEFGFTPVEIKTFKMFVLGDDNIIMFPFEYHKAQQFFDFLISYAKDRWKMIINAEKSKCTNLRRDIEVLGYTNNQGLPTRDIGKLVAQLAYPERHCDYNAMITRSIGMCYASAASLPLFHDLCLSVYKHYLNKIGNEPYTPVIKGLPGQLQHMLGLDEVPLDHFPTITEIYNRVSSWKGPLNLIPYWNPQYFLEPPWVIREQYQTLLRTHDS
nr:MAG: putative RNA dependent RNA polymerase [Kalajoki betapartitivirus]